MYLLRGLEYGDKPTGWGWGMSPCTWGEVEPPIYKNLFGKYHIPNICKNFPQFLRGTDLDN